MTEKPIHPEAQRLIDMLIADNLVLEGGLIDDKLKEFINSSTYDPDTIEIKWCTDDVILLVQEKTNYAKTLSKEDAALVLGRVKWSHDCNYGVTWDSLHSAITSLLDETEITLVDAKQEDLLDTSAVVGKYNGYYDIEEVIDWV